MEIAIWIIAACEVIRVLQYQTQLDMIEHDNKRWKNLYSEFIKSLKQTDKEFVKRVLQEFEKEEP